MKVTRLLSDFFFFGMREMREMYHPYMGNWSRKYIALSQILNTK